MNPASHWMVLFFLVAGWHDANAGAPPAPSVHLIQLTIDGAFAGNVSEVEGGDPRSTVVAEASVAGAIRKKHISGVSYAPMKFKVAFPFTRPVFDCVNDLCMNRSSRKTLVLTHLDPTLKVIGTPLEAVRALLTEVHFAGFNLASEGLSQHVTLVFQPESTRPSLAAARPAQPFPKPVSPIFKLSINGLSTSGVFRIEPFTMKQAVETTPPTFSNLVVTAVGSDAADWNTWRDSFVVQGLNQDANEKRGSLQMLDATGTAVLFALEFANMGIIRASPEPITGKYDGASRFQAELYYETVALVAAPLVALTAVTPVTPAASVPTSPVATTPSANRPVSVTTMPALGTPVATAPAILVGREPVGFTSPADQGGRDPKDFPRMGGTVRKSYSAIQQKTSVQEMAAYTIPESLDSIEEFYTKALAVVGWELITRHENNDAVGRMHQIILNWKTALRTVAITLTEVKSGGSEIGVNLTTKI